MEKENVELYVCTYGNEIGKEKGLVKIHYNKKENKISKELCFSIDGKANMAIVNDNVMYVSEQRKDGIFLVTYDTKTRVKIEETRSKYFYSWGTYKDGLLYLASFSDGVDSVYDVNGKKFISTYVHEDETNRTGRSHYINVLKDGQIISVDNALQKIYFYKNSKLEVEKILSYPEINIRLLSISNNEKYAYMNTEKTNEIYVIDVEGKETLCSTKMSENEGFSGGNTISEDGKILAVSVRGENKIYVYEIKNDIELNLKQSFACGAIPRDLEIKENLLFVSCTADNCVEVYELETYAKIASIDLCQPITFGM